MLEIHKQDRFSFSRDQKRAGRAMWDRAGRVGKLGKSSFDAESAAPKAWIRYQDGSGMEIGVVECEVYTVGRVSDSSEAVVMLHGMCPKCGETFLAREDNKTMSLDRISYRKAPKFFRVHWAYHCKHVLARQPRDDDQILLVSSPERWACDYCKGWCVRVHAGIAVDDYRGVTQLTVPVGVTLIGDKKRVTTTDV